jgi:sec-independent protein translocase protein TatA
MHPIYAGLLAGGPELFIVLGIVALLFGSAKIPQFARSLGQAKHEFEKGTHGTDKPVAVSAPPTTPQD